MEEVEYVELDERGLLGQSVSRSIGIGPAGPVKILDVRVYARSDDAEAVVYYQKVV